MGTGEFRGRILVLGCALLYSVGTTAAPAEAKFIGQRPSRGCINAILLVSALTVGYLSPYVYHDLTGVASGHPHIGHGIHLDWPELLESLSPEERKLLEDPKLNGKEIIALFSQKLSAVYDEALEHEIHWFPETRYASEFISEEGKVSAVCRHQARVLAAILNHLGIEAEIWQGYQSDVDMWHAWVEVPSLNLIADPGLSAPVSIQSFHQDFLEIERLTFRKRWVSGVIY